MDEESFTAVPPETPAPLDSPKPNTTRSVLDILQPVLSTHPYLMRCLFPRHHGHTLTCH